MRAVSCFKLSEVWTNARLAVFGPCSAWITLALTWKWSTMLRDLIVKEPDGGAVMHTYRGVLPEKVEAYRALLADEWPGAEIEDIEHDPKEMDLLDVPEFLRQPPRV